MLDWPRRCGVDQLQIQRNRDPARYLVLQRERIADVAVEPLSPQMRVGFGIDQLSGDADPVSRPLDIAGQHVADIKLAADLLCIDWLVPIGESGIARDDEQIRDAR